MVRFPDEVWSLIRAYRPRRSPTASCIALVPPELLRTLAAFCMERSVGWRVWFLWDHTLHLRLFPNSADNVRRLLRAHNFSRLRALVRKSLTLPATPGIFRSPATVRSLGELSCFEM